MDVRGKIALVSRGSSSFPDKQAAAQAAGAIGIVVYNNASGMLNMQINDGGDNIPAVFVSKADGEYMKAQFAEGVKTLTCCNGDLVQVKARPYPQRLLLLGRHPGPEAEAGDRRCWRQHLFHP